MADRRTLVALLAFAAAPIALLAPWEYVLVGDVCVAEPCAAPHRAALGGFESGGWLAALAAAAGGLVVLFARSENGRTAAAALLVAGFSWALAAPSWPRVLVFAEPLGPAWGSSLAAALMVCGAVALFVPAMSASPTAGGRQV